MKNNITTLTPENHPQQSQPTSIRQRLIRYLLVGLPLLFLVISLAVSLPLYQQILAEEDASMKQFAQMMLKQSSASAEHDVLNDLLTEDEQQLDLELLASLSDDDALLPTGADFVIWDKSGNLLTSSLMDDAPQDNDSYDKKHRTTHQGSPQEQPDQKQHQKQHQKLENQREELEKEQITTNQTSASERYPLFYDAVSKHAAAHKAKHSTGTSAQSGFINTGNMFATDAWRVYYATHARSGETIVVAQRWELRLGNIWTFVFEQMWLLLLSLPLLVGMVIWAVHKGLRPINQLTKTVQQRHANDLAPVSQAVPKELQPLTTALNQLFQRVTVSIDKEKRFTADASHELKSPITAIKLQANELEHSLMQRLANQTAQNQGIQSTDIQSPANAETDDTLASIESLQRIQRTANRASHLVEQLLTLTKLTDQDEHAFEKQPINWMNVSDDALQSVSLAARKQGVKLVRHLPSGADVMPLTGSPALLSLLLRNLLDNAIHYGSAQDVEDGGSLEKSALEKDVMRNTVELTLAHDHISVRDHGKGIAPEHLQRIHERFFRPAGQTHTGSGLGLSIVERIAQLHGLQVQIDNHPEGGVIVVVGFSEK